MDVYVEAWLTDEQYQSAKEHGDLAWQNSAVPSTPATPGDVSVRDLLMCYFGI